MAVDFVDTTCSTLADISERPKTCHAYHEDTFRACALGIRAVTAADQVGLFRADRLAHTSAVDQLRSSTIRSTRMTTIFSAFGGSKEHEENVMVVEL